MAATPPASEPPAGQVSTTGRSNLVLRIVSSLVLAPIAIAAAYYGGWLFLAFWTVAAALVLWEWDTLVCAHDRDAVLATGALALAGAAVSLAFDRLDVAVLLIALGVLGVAALASSVRRGWCIAGLLYAAALLVAPVLLRNDAGFGFAAILFVFVVVWLTDIVAYFTGRAAGGPKLMPRVSPNKTWSGAIGGTLAAVVGGALVARYAGAAILPAAMVAFVLSIASQAGDLAESALKRRFSAKDSSQLIPGHGGLMDRLDGFVAAAAAGALVGIAHGGLDVPARGLLVW